jgi:hypothetical protein
MALTAVAVVVVMMTGENSRSKGSLEVELLLEDIYLKYDDQSTR